MSAQSQSNHTIIFIINHIASYTQQYLDTFRKSCPNLSQQYSEISVQAELIRETATAFNAQFQPFANYLNPYAIVDKVLEERLREFVISSCELNTSLTAHVPHLIHLLDSTLEIVKHVTTRFHSQFTPQVIQTLQEYDRVEVSNTTSFLVNIADSLPFYTQKLSSLQEESYKYLAFVRPFYFTLYFPINASELEQLIRDDPSRLEVVYGKILDLKPPAPLKVDDLARWSTDASKSLFVGRILRWQTSINQDLQRVVEMLKIYSSSLGESSVERRCYHKTVQFQMEYALSLTNNENLKRYLDNIVSAVNRQAAAHLRSSGRTINLAHGRAFQGFRDNVPILPDNTDAVTTLPDYQSASFHHLKQGFCPHRPFNGVPAKLFSNLFQFQLAGIDFVFKRRGRALIGDEMGCGKTLQAIGAMCMYLDEWPVLLIVPPTLRYNWVKEILTWCSEFIWPENVISIESSNQQFPELRRGKQCVVIVSYGIATTLQDSLLQEPFGVIICDESHYLKSPKASRTKAIIPLVKKIPRAILLSGTPIISRPEEIFSQIHALKPQVFTHPKYFRQRYDVVNRLRALEDDADLDDLQLQIQQTREMIDSGDGDASLERTLAQLERQHAHHLARVQGCHHYLKELNAMLREYVMVRRLKKDVLSELKGKTRTVVNTKIERSNENERVFRLYQRILSLLPHAEEALKKYTQKKSIFASRTQKKPSPDDANQPSVGFKASLQANREDGMGGQYPSPEDLDGDDDDDDDGDDADQKDSVFESLMNQEDEQLIQLLERQVKNRSVLDYQQQRALIVKLYQLTGILKIPFVRQYVEDLIDSDVKFLVFAHHIPVLDAIQELLEKKKVGFFRVDGSVSLEERQLGVEAFQKRSDVRVALLSITAAGLGLTLTAAHVAVFAELYWTPSALIQAEDRCHRVGQNEAVSIYYLLADDSLDSHIWPLIQQKFQANSIALDGFQDKAFKQVQMMNEHANLSVNKIAALSVPMLDSSSSSALVTTTTTTMTTTTTTTTTTTSSSTESHTSSDAAADDGEARTTASDDPASIKVPAEYVGKHLQKRGIRTATELYNRWKTNSSYTRRIVRRSSNSRRQLVDNDLTMEKTPSDEAEAKKERFKYHILRVNNKRELGLPLGVIPCWSDQWHLRLYTFETFDAQFYQHQRAINTSFSILLRDATTDRVSALYLDRMAKDEMTFASTHLIKYTDGVGYSREGYVQVEDIPQYPMYWPHYKTELPDDSLDLDLRAEFDRIADYRRKYPQNVEIYKRIEKYREEMKPLEQELELLKIQHENAIKFLAPEQSLDTLAANPQRTAGSAVGDTATTLTSATPGDTTLTGATPGDTAKNQPAATSSSSPQAASNLKTPFSSKIEAVETELLKLQQRITTYEQQIRGEPFQSIPNGLPVTHSVQLFQPYSSILHPRRVYSKPFAESATFTSIVIRKVSPEERPAPPRLALSASTQKPKSKSSERSSPKDDLSRNHTSSLSSFILKPQSSRGSTTSTTSITSTTSTAVARTSSSSLLSIDSSDDENDGSTLLTSSQHRVPTTVSSTVKKPKIIESLSRSSLLEKLKSRGDTGHEHIVHSLSIHQPRVQREPPLSPTQSDIEVLNPRDRLAAKYQKDLNSSSDDDDGEQDTDLFSDDDDGDDNTTTQAKGTRTMILSHTDDDTDDAFISRSLSASRTKPSKTRHMIEMEDGSSNDDVSHDDYVSPFEHLSSAVDNGYVESLIVDDSCKIQAHTAVYSTRTPMAPNYIPPSPETKAKELEQEETKALLELESYADSHQAMTHASHKSSRESISSPGTKKSEQNEPYWQSYLVDKDEPPGLTRLPSGDNTQGVDVKGAPPLSPTVVPTQPQRRQAGVSAVGSSAYHSTSKPVTAADDPGPGSLDYPRFFPDTSKTSHRSAGDDDNDEDEEELFSTDNDDASSGQNKEDIWTILAHRQLSSKPSKVLLKSAKNPLLSPNHPSHHQHDSDDDDDDDDGGSDRSSVVQRTASMPSAKARGKRGHSFRSGGPRSSHERGSSDTDGESIGDDDSDGYSGDDDDDDDSLDGFIVHGDEETTSEELTDERLYSDGKRSLLAPPEKPRANDHMYDISDDDDDDDPYGLLNAMNERDHDDNSRIYSQPQADDESLSRTTFGSKPRTKRSTGRGGGSRSHSTRSLPPDTPPRSGTSSRVTRAASLESKQQQKRDHTTPASKPKTQTATPSKAVAPSYPTSPITIVLDDDDDDDDIFETTPFIQLLSDKKTPPPGSPSNPKTPHHLNTPGLIDITSDVEFDHVQSDTLSESDSMDLPPLAVVTPDHTTDDEQSNSEGSGVDAGIGMGQPTVLSQGRTISRKHGNGDASDDEDDDNDNNGDEEQLPASSPSLLPPLKRQRPPFAPPQRLDASQSDKLVHLRQTRPTAISAAALETRAQRGSAVAHPSTTLSLRSLLQKKRGFSSLASLHSASEAKDGEAYSSNASKPHHDEKGAADVDGDSFSDSDNAHHQHVHGPSPRNSQKSDESDDDDDDDIGMKSIRPKPRRAQLQNKAVSPHPIQKSSPVRSVQPSPLRAALMAKTTPLKTISRQKKSQVIELD